MLRFLNTKMFHQEQTVETINVFYKEFQILLYFVSHKKIIFLKIHSEEPRSE